MSISIQRAQIPDPIKQRSIIQTLEAPSSQLLLRAKQPKINCALGSDEQQTIFSIVRLFNSLRETLEKAFFEIK